MSYRRTSYGPVTGILVLLVLVALALATAAVGLASVAFRASRALTRAVVDRWHPW